VELPDDHWGCDLGGRDDRYGDGPVFFKVDEGEFFKLAALLVSLGGVALDKGYEVGSLAFGIEVSGGYTRAFAGMVALPSLGVGAGEVLGLQDGPAALLDRSADRWREVVQAVLCACVRREGEEDCEENAF